MTPMEMVMAGILVLEIIIGLLMLRLTVFMVMWNPGQFTIWEITCKRCDSVFKTRINWVPEIWIRYHRLRCKGEVS